MTICCKNVHKLDLSIFFNFCVAYLPAKRDIKTKLTYFLFWTCMSEIRNHMFILRNQNKKTDFG